MDLNSFQELSLSLEELCQFLKGNDVEVQEHVVHYILLMTGDLHKTRDIYENKYILKELLRIASHSNDKIGHLALNSFINITGSDEGSLAVLEVGESEEEVIGVILKLVLDCNSSLADHGCKILANMTIHERMAVKVSKVIVDHDNYFAQIVEAICNSRTYNRNGCKIEHLAQFLGNLGQSSTFQDYLLHIACDKFVLLLSVVYYGVSILERRGIVALIYNCLFNSKNHNILLGDPFCILPVLLYSLAGPEEFEDSEYDSMPIELQYLPGDKKREIDPGIRNILLKSLLLICATKYGRIFLRDNQTYLVLREYHKWEEDRNNLLNCENVIDILIRTEEEIGVDDLKSLQVPEDLQEKFQKWDLDYVNDS